jgi:hypothetical protein
VRFVTGESQARSAEPDSTAVLRQVVFNFIPPMKKSFEFSSAFWLVPALTRDDAVGEKTVIA